MNLTHATMRPFLGLDSFTRLRIRCVSLSEGRAGESKILHRMITSRFAIARFAVHSFLNMRMALIAWQKSAHADLILILEFEPKYMLIPNLLLLPLRRRLIFFAHGMQQLATVSFLNYWPLALFRACRYHVMQLERDDSVLAPKYRMPPARVLILPFPVADIPPLESVEPAQPGSKVVTIGLVGMWAPGKNRKELVEILRSLSQESNGAVRVVLGLPHWDQELDTMKKTGLEVVSTSSKNDYWKCLRSVDIAVQDFDRRFYFYRASALVSDAVSAGCHVVCPDYPVLSRQINWPVRVGTTYDGIENLPDAVRQAIEYVRTKGRGLPAEYSAARGKAQIASKIETYAVTRMGLALPSM